MKILMVTSEWPSLEHPHSVPFIVRQVKYLEKNGVVVDVFTFRGNKNPFKYLKAIIQCQVKIFQEKYDLAHAQFGQSGLPVLFSSLPLIVTFRGSDLEGIVKENGTYTVKGKILKMVSQIVAHKAEAIILVSQKLSQHLPPSKPYSVIPSGIEFDKFKPISKKLARERLNLPLDKKIIFFGGRPESKVKRYDLAKKALELVKNEMDLELLVATGLPHKEIPYYMGASDLLLLTSKHEGSPNVVKEALACNLPVVSVNVGDVEERIAHIPGCYLCENDSPEEISKGILTVISNNQPFEGLNYIQPLDEGFLTKKVIAIYQEVMKKKK